MITRPDKGNDNEIGNDNRRVLNALLRNQRARKSDAQNPSDRVERRQNQNQRGLSKKRWCRQEQRTGRRIHERKILRVRVKLVAAQHGSPSVKPGPVVHVGAAVQKADEWKKGESYRRSDK